MTRLKDATFESNSTTGTDAFNSASGATINASSLIKGTYCARTQWATAVNVTGSMTGLGSNSELYTSFYLRVAQIQTSGTPRLVTSSNGSTQWVIDMSTAGAMRIRNNGTNLATILTPTLNTTYRIGVYFKPSSSAGAADAILRVYVATGDAAFSATPTYENTAYTMNTSNANISSIVFGQNNASGNQGDYYWDDIRIDNAAMPGPSVTITHSIKTGNWRWYSDSASDAGLTALAAENTAPTLTAAQMQAGAVLRLRLQLIEQSGGAGTGTIALQYGGDTTTFQSIGDNPLGTSEQGYFAAFGSGGATHLATISATKLTGSNESGTYRESTSATAESVGASKVHEIDIAIIIRYPPPNATLYFRLVYAGGAVDAAATYSLPSLTTSTVANRGWTVDKLASQSSSGAGELQRPQYNRLIWDGTNYWAFVTDSSDTTKLNYYYWDGQAASNWTAAGSTTFTGPVNAGRMWITFANISGNKIVHAYYYRSGGYWQRRGTISGTSISWQFEDESEGSGLTGNATVGQQHIVFDAQNKLTLAYLDASNVSACRSTSAADSGGSGFFPSFSGATVSSVADPDGSTAAGGGIQVVPLTGSESLIVWQSQGNLKAVKYTGSAMGTVQTLNSSHVSDWYAVKHGSYVYIALNTDISSALALYVYDITGNSFAAAASPSMTVVSGDGLAAVPGATNEVYIIGNFTGAAGGTDRVLKYKKYTGPGSGGSYGSLTTISSSASRGKGRYIAPQQVQGSSNRVVVLWEFGEDTITLTPFALEYHGINLFNAFLQTITATSAPARSFYKKPTKAILRAGAPARSIYKKPIKTILRAGAPARSIAKVAKLYRTATAASTKTIKKIGSLSRKATSIPSARPQKNVKPLPKLVSTTGLASSSRKIVQIVIVLAVAHGVASMRRLATLYKKITTGSKSLYKLVRPAPKVAHATSLGVVRKVVSKPLGAIEQLAPSRRAVVSLYRRATSSTVKSLHKVASKTLTRAETVAATTRRIVSKPIQVVIGHLQAMSKTLNRVLAVVSALGSPIRKIVSKTRLTTSSAATSRRLNVILLRRVTSTLAPRVSRLFKLMLTAGAWPSPTRSKHVLLTRRATQYGLSYSQRRIAKTLSRPIAATARISKEITKRLKATGTALGSLIKHRIVTVILLVALSPIARRASQIVKRLRVATGTPKLLKVAVKRLTVAGLVTAKAPVKSVVKRLSRLTTAQTTAKRLTTKPIRSTAQTTAAPLKIIRKTFTALALKTASARKIVTLKRLTSSAPLGSLRRIATKRLQAIPFIYGDTRKALLKRLGGALGIGQAKILKGASKRLSANLGASGGMQRRATLTRLIFSNGLPRMQRHATLILRRVVSSTSVLVKWRIITRIVQATSTGSARIGKVARLTRLAVSAASGVVRKQLLKALGIVSPSDLFMPRTTSKRLHATSTGHAIPQKLVRLYRVVHATLHATLYKKPIKYIRASASGLLGRRLQLTKVVRRAVTHLGSSPKAITRTLRTSAGSVAQIVRGIPEAISKSARAASAAINSAVVSFGGWVNRRRASMDDTNTEGDG